MNALPRALLQFGVTCWSAIPNAWWRLHASDRRFCLWTFALAAASLVVTVWVVDQQASRLSVEIAQTSALIAEIHFSKNALDTRVIEGQDRPWWMGVPKGSASEAASYFANFLLRAAEERKIIINELTVSSIDQSDQHPPYVSAALQISATGDYRSIKEWLSRLLADRPYAITVRRIDLQRKPSENGITMVGQLTLYAKN